MIRCIIVDDEPLAREGLRLYLNEAPDIDIIAECANGREALRAISELTPDVVFLDVQMPGTNGVDLARALPNEGRPLLVFLTAYSEHAIDAFGVEALDYLLKPLSTTDLQRCLQRIRAHLQQRRHTQRWLAEQQHAPMSVTTATPARLRFRADGSLHLIAPEEISHISAAGDYVVLHLGARQLVVRETLSALTSSLASTGFVRVHRSTLVNLSYITEWHNGDDGDGYVQLRDGSRHKVGRQFVAELNRAINVGR